MLEVEKKKVSCDDKGDVYGFIYQTACIETPVEDYPVEWIEEDLFYHNIPKFFVLDGVVYKRTVEECIAYMPEADKEIKSSELKVQFENQTDSMMYDFIEFLADKYKDEYPKAKEWLDKKKEIRK